MCERTVDGSCCATIVHFADTLITGDVEPDHESPDGRVVCAQYAQLYRVGATQFGVKAFDEIAV